MFGQTGTCTRQGSALDGVLVVDITLTDDEPSDLVSLLLCRLLGSAGADVVRVLPETRRAETRGGAPLLCGAAGDGHGQWQLLSPWDGSRFVAKADVLISRADNLSIRHSSRIHAPRNERIPESAVVVTIGAGEFDDDRQLNHSHELVAQTLSGAVFEHMPGRPAYNGTQIGAYGAAINGATAVVAALVDRMDTGVGQNLRVSRWAGSLAFMGMVWSITKDDRGCVHPSIPVGADIPLFECADGEYLCLSSSPRCRNPLEVLANLLEMDVDPNDLRGKRSFEDLAGYYYNYELMAPVFKKFTSSYLVQRLGDADFAVELVRPPGAAWEMPEVKRGGILNKCSDCGGEYVGNPVEWG